MSLQALNMGLPEPAGIQEGRAFLASMEKLLHLLQQPVQLRRNQEVEILQLGPYQLPAADLPPFSLAACFRQSARRGLRLPPDRRESLDFQIRWPWPVMPAQQPAVARLLLELNRALPLGCFELISDGRLIYLFELPLQQPQLPAGTFLECIALMLGSFRQAAPLLSAAQTGRSLPDKSLFGEKGFALADLAGTPEARLLAGG